MFTVEVVLRVVALGSLLSYLKHAWNVFDVAMVLVGYTAFIPASDSGGMRALRALRALRPLRTLTRFESLRSIVVCFLEVGGGPGKGQGGRQGSDGVGWGRAGVGQG